MSSTDNSDPGLPPELVGTAGADVLEDETGFGSVIDGLAGDDVLIGLDGDDTLLGGAGDDVLLGGEGADTIVGGSGHDLMFGNASEVNEAGFVVTTADSTAADTFVFQPGGGTDAIADFDAGIDVIDLSAIDTIASMNDLTILDHGSSTVIDLGPANGTITLHGFNADNLSEADFIFSPPSDIDDGAL